MDYDQVIGAPDWAAGVLRPHVVKPPENKQFWLRVLGARTPGTLDIHVQIWLTAEPVAKEKESDHKIIACHAYAMAELDT